MDRNLRDWSTLPVDLLSIIAGGLKTPSDTLRFGAVCKKFLLAIRFQKTPSSFKGLRIPVPVPASKKDIKPPDRCFQGYLVLTESVFYAIEPLPSRTSNINVSTKTFIVRLQKSSLTGRMQVKEPLSRFRFRHLARSLPKTLNLMDFQVHELHKSYGLDFVVVRKRKDRYMNYDNMESTSFHKVVVATCLDEHYRDFAVMVTQGIGEMNLWRNGEPEWISIYHLTGKSFSVVDVVYHKHRFYAIDIRGFAISIDHRTSKIYDAANKFFEPIPGLKYLVSSHDHLFLVVKTHLPFRDELGYGICMSVYVLDEVNHVWLYVEGGLDDRTFFVGDDCSFSVSAEEFPELRSNSVYFNDDEFAEASEAHPGWYPGIYDVKYEMIGPLAGFPRHSKLYWPAPNWLARIPAARAGR
ncbi:hypothetical protein Patl1_29211 [Pistacia atlantica]|uniref:Uncharacterized protein n=1 Tax=Pistacia atlantica TaxID=434234 RepID=A0ACC1BGH3_9ROSI|nr:hypothetical protein Patl1_29211 [Pistacia atlantica]